MDITGKTIAIVGGSDSTVSKDIINNHDIVVQVNYHWLRRQDQRVDILWHNGSSRNPPSQFYENRTFLDNCTEVFTSEWAPSMDGFREFCSNHCMVFNTYGPNRANVHNWWFASMQKWLMRLGAQEVLAGVAAITYFLRFDIVRLDTYSMDLYLHDPKKTPGTINHNPVAHAMWLERLAQYDDRLHLNPELLQGMASLLEQPEALYLLHANLRQALQARKAGTI